MHGVIVKDNCSDHNRQSNKVKKMGRLITGNTRHIQKTLKMAEQYIRRPLMKGTGCLEDIFTDTNSNEHNRLFNLNTAGTLVSTYHGRKQEDMMPDQYIKGVSVGTNKTDGMTMIQVMKSLGLRS